LSEDQILLLAGFLPDRGAELATALSGAALEVPVADALAAAARRHRAPPPAEPLETWLALWRDQLSAAGELRPAVLIARALWQGLAAARGRTDPEAAVALAAVGRLLVAGGKRTEGDRCVEGAFRALAQQGEMTRAELVLASGLASDRERLFQSARAGSPERAPLVRVRAMARLLTRRGAFAQAEPLWVQLSDGDDAIAAEAHGELAQGYDALGRAEQALRHAEESVRRARRSGEDALPQRLTVLARLLLGRARTDEAVALLEEALEAEEDTDGVASAAAGRRQVSIGKVLLAAGRGDEALGWIESGAGALRASMGDRDPITQAAAALLVGALLDRSEVSSASRNRGEAALARERAAMWIGPVLPHDHPAAVRLRRLGAP
jgi:tetratricopeptide (TPR) repeat protein